MNPDIRPQDDLFGHVNGRWLDSTEIPSDRSAWGAFTALAEEAEHRVKAIIEELAANGPHEPGSNAQKIGDLYSSFMDEARAEALGAEPIRDDLVRLRGLDSHEALAAFVGSLERLIDLTYQGHLAEEEGLTLDNEHVLNLFALCSRYDAAEQAGVHLVEGPNSDMNTVVVSLTLTHKDPVKREIFNNEDFRVGLSHAIDRQAIIDSAFVFAASTRSDATSSISSVPRRSSSWRSTSPRMRSPSTCAASSVATMRKLLSASSTVVRVAAGNMPVLAQPASSSAGRIERSARGPRIGVLREEGMR